MAFHSDINRNLRMKDLTWEIVEPKMVKPEEIELEKIVEYKNVSICPQKPILFEPSYAPTH